MDVSGGNGLPMMLQVFEDVSGGIVVSFDATRAITEGDLSAYMQNFARNNSVVSGSRPAWHCVAAHASLLLIEPMWAAKYLLRMCSNFGIAIRATFCGDSCAGLRVPLAKGWDPVGGGGR